jgi:replicative DNA helicase
MDRDQRWERIERATQAMTGNAGSAAGQDPLEALDGLYANEPRGDEFIKPLLLDPDGAIGDGDSLVFFNFRSDRARQISKKFLEGPKPKLSAFCGMTEYDAKMPLPAAFSPLPLTHLFGELLEEKGLRQFRVAETEKYAHVTFFFNGGREAPFRGEDRILAMRAVARRLKRERGIGLIIVDYLQLMSPTSTKSSDSLVQQVTEISRSLKGLARELEVPVIALSQLSRAVEQRGGKPRLSDLRDSGSIEQDADIVMFIHREDKRNAESDRPNIAEILIEKHRNGPTGSTELYFDEKRASFQPLDTAGYGDLAGEF